MSLEKFEKEGILEFDGKSQMEENARVQKEYSLNEYKRSAKMTALNSAINLRPYVNSAATLVSTPDESFDVIKKADEIYEWLLKI